MIDNILFIFILSPMSKSRLSRKLTIAHGRNASFKKQRTNVALREQKEKAEEQNQKTYNDVAGV
jgi:hypothetical protein